MSRHSFDTYNILCNIKGLVQVALSAAQHHNRAGGSSLEARIIVVPDNLPTCWHVAMQVRPNTEPVVPA